MKNTMLKLGLISLLIILAGCTPKIVRNYAVTITVSENSTVYFLVDVLADIKKDADLRTQTETDAAMRIPFIPGAFGM